MRQSPLLRNGRPGRSRARHEDRALADDRGHLHDLGRRRLVFEQGPDGQEIAEVLEIPHSLVKSRLFDGLKRLYEDGETAIYYITLQNEPYAMPAMPENVREDIINGIYKFKSSESTKNKELTTNLFGSGAIIKEVLEAASILEEKHEIPVNVWSVTSYKQLYDGILEKEGSEESFFEKQLKDEGELVVAVSDYVKALPLSIANHFKGKFIAMGTDGFGESDETPVLRKLFKISADDIVKKTLSYWREQGKINGSLSKSKNTKKKNKS